MNCIYRSLLLLIFSAALNAEENIQWSIKGFGTLGFTGSDSSTLGFYRSKIQTQDVTDAWGLTTDSRLGLQVDVDINQSLHATVQWVARDHAGDFFEQNLDWAFLRWNFNDTTNIRVGRIGADLFLLSDYRNVGYAYPWMRPPHEFYSHLALYHFDGFDFKHKIYISENLLTIKLFSGYSFTQIPAHTVGIVNLGSPMAGGSLKFESENWTTRAGYAYLRLIDDVPNKALVSALNDPLVNFGIPGIKQVIPKLSLKDTNVHYYSLGAAYDDGAWIVQAEASYIDSETAFFPDTANAYLSIGKRISTVTVYTLFGISHSYQSDVNVPTPLIPSPQLQHLHQVVDRSLNKNGSDQKSVSLGLRWDLYQNIAFKTQWSHYWMGANGTQYWEDPSSKERSSQVNVWSLGFDFIF
ncbi:MAG: hypothetical protein GQ532_11390 [Methylomarinum sp.]|nr:hypothetical protein [Methylomarinum sp.]